MGGMWLLSTSFFSLGTRKELREEIASVREREIGVETDNIAAFPKV